MYSDTALLATIAGSTTTYHHGDHLSVRVTTDTTGNVLAQQAHYPFGETWYQGSGATKWQFTSYERDAESGNDYAMFRYHVNRLGRFSSPDPIAGSPADPQSLNRYAYVLNDPLNLVDPLGLDGCEGRDPNFCVEVIGEGPSTLDMICRFSPGLCPLGRLGRGTPVGMEVDWEAIREARRERWEERKAKLQPPAPQPPARPSKPNPLIADLIDRQCQQYQDCVRQATRGLVPAPTSEDVVREAQRDSMKPMRPNVPGLPAGGNMPTPPGKGPEADFFRTILDIRAYNKRKAVEDDCENKFPLARLSSNFKRDTER